MHLSIKFSNSKHENLPLVYIDPEKDALIHSVDLCLYSNKYVDLYVYFRDYQAYLTAKKSLGRDIPFIDEYKGIIQDQYVIRFRTKNHLLLNFILNKLITLSPSLAKIETHHRARSLGMDLSNSYSSLDEISENVRRDLTQRESTGGHWIESRSPETTFTNLNPSAILTEIQLLNNQLTGDFQIECKCNTEQQDLRLKKLLLTNGVPLEHYAVHVCFEDEVFESTRHYFERFIQLLRYFDPTIDNSTYRRISEAINSYSPDRTDLIRFSGARTTTDISASRMSYYTKYTSGISRARSDDSLTVNHPRYTVNL